MERKGGRTEKGRQRREKTIPDAGKETGGRQTKIMMERRQDWRQKGRKRRKR